MASHMRQETDASTSEPIIPNQDPASSDQNPVIPTQNPTIPNQDPASSDQDPVMPPTVSQNEIRTPRVSDPMPQKMSIPDKKPSRKWPALILILVIAVVGIAFVWLFVVPRVTGNSSTAGLGSIGDFFGGNNGSNSSSSTETNIATATGTWDLSTDLLSPVSLKDVTDEGITLEFLPDGESGFLTIHIVSFTINGESHDPTAADDPIKITVFNQSTGETVQTIDPYFITSGASDASNATDVTIKVDGMSADQYESMELTIDESIATGDISSGDYDVADHNGLTLNIKKTA